MNLLDERRRQVKQLERRKRLGGVTAVFEDLKRTLVWEPPPPASPSAQPDATSPRGSPRSAREPRGRARVEIPELKGPPTAHEVVLQLYQVLTAWYLTVRGGAYRRRRAQLRGALAWEGPARARALMDVRTMLVDAQRVSWFSAPVRYPHCAAGDVPCSSSDHADAGAAQPPRGDAAGLRWARRQRAPEAPRHGRVREGEPGRAGPGGGASVDVPGQHKGSGDVKKLRRQGEQADRQLEAAKELLVKAPAFLRLVELVHATFLTWSVEDAATLLLQAFQDTSSLQLPVMAYPGLAPASTSGAAAAAVFQTSPSHVEVQGHLNALLEAVVDAAEPLLEIQQKDPPQENPSSRSADGEADGLERAGKEETSLIRLYLSSSRPYRQAVKGLDRQLKRCFRAAERCLRGAHEQLGEPLSVHAALLACLYADRPGLARHIAHWGPPGCGPEPGATAIGNRLLADFVFFWLAGPHAHLGEARQILQPLFHCVAMVCASDPGLSLETAPLPAGGLGQPPRGGPAVVEEAGEATAGGAGCARLYPAFRDVQRASASLSDLLLRQVVREGKFAEHVEGFPEGLEQAPALCSWFRELVERCQRWHDAVKGMRQVHQCGPLRLDMSFLSFSAAQVPAALLGAGAYLLNLYAVRSGRTLFRSVQAALGDIATEPASLAEIVREMLLLRGMHARTLEYRKDHKRLEELYQALAAAARLPVLTTPVSRLVGTQVTLHVDRGEGEVLSQLGFDMWRQPGGGLSTAALAFLVETAGESLALVETRAGSLMGDVAGRASPFRGRAEEAAREVSLNAEALLLEMESALSPCDRLAEDARLAEDPRWTSWLRDDDDVGYGGLDPSSPAFGTPAPPPIPRRPLVRTISGKSPPLSTGDHYTHQEVQAALASFEGPCAELQRRGSLVAQYQELTGGGGHPLPSAADGRHGVVQQRLSALQAFWGSVREWDRLVDGWLESPPADVRIDEVQRHVRSTLRAAARCPEGHMTLLRQRVDRLRRLLPQLALVQSLAAGAPLKGGAEGGAPALHARLLRHSLPGRTRRVLQTLSEMLCRRPADAEGTSRPVPSLGGVIRRGLLNDGEYIARIYQLAVADDGGEPPEETAAPAGGGGERAGAEEGAPPIAAEADMPPVEQRADGPAPGGAAEAAAAQELAPPVAPRPPSARRGRPTPPAAPRAPAAAVPLPPPLCRKPWRDRGAPREAMPPGERRAWRLPPTAELGGGLGGGGDAPPHREQLRGLRGSFSRTQES
ncbi:unnamed protein product [Prorocentrum cordatum]|uniref:Uncharacterized protein n=1 Tax=Prorocentrum cordatum TaxID=2364126 RepID=A0ABN9TLS1_9DINO|nr:unnamed protein product [Polarella glacialis]